VVFVKRGIRVGYIRLHSIFVRKKFRIRGFTMNLSREKREGFWSKVDMSAGPDACWPWKGGVYKSGYGTAYWHGRSGRRAHRVAYQVAFGDIPEKMLVLHKCDNTLCVNPNHLFLGTHQDNMNDMRVKGRARNAGDQKGEANFAAKLSLESVGRIRFLYSSKLTVAEISRRTSVPYSNVWSIVHRKTWKHV